MIAARSAWPLAAAATAVGAASAAMHGQWAAAATCALGMIAAGFGQIEFRRRLDRVAARLAAIGDTHSDATLEQLVDSVAAQLASVETRLVHRHRVTGLATREPLLRAMAEAGSGVLGLIAFRDFDRMCAFDEGQGERAMVVLVGRMRRMLGEHRLLAQVDRAQVAIWYGDVARENAQRELEALAYALGERIDDSVTGLSIVPDVGSACVSLPDDGATATAALTRAIALLRPGGAPDSAALNPIGVARDLYEIEQDLRRAIPHGEFELLYQPLVDAASCSVGGAEALLRWQHPTRGTISPSRFVPIAEQAGLADEIGLWTLNTACREARRWQQLGLTHLHVAVNASGHQLERDDMAALVQRTLARHGLSPDALLLELTETVAANDVTRAARLFAEIRAMGVRIAIDDFGTGFSSLSALRQLSFDKLKIDREFVTHVDTRADSQAICQSIIALGRGLGIRVLAEGVERAEEYRWLRSHGCIHFQGYYFAQPLTGEAFVAFVADRERLRTLLSTDARALQGDLKKRMHG